MRLGDRVVFIDRRLTAEEMPNLVRCCDCFVSLHRAEGFGRGLAEAMFLAKPVIATAYSGNMDYMSAENSLPVDYRLVPVADGCYPFHAGQVWAEADVAQAVAHMVCLYDDPRKAKKIGMRAAESIRRTHGYAVIGKVYRDRINTILDGLVD
jgi:glycosyltransferase involved in cell wall biosynthesis